MAGFGGGEGGVRVSLDGDDALDEADALCVVTEWQEFRNPDFDYLKHKLNQPVIFDGRNLWDPKQMAAQLKRALNDAWRQVTDLKVKELLDKRYERLQSYGRFSDTKAGK